MKQIINIIILLIIISCGNTLNQNSTQVVDYQDTIRQKADKKEKLLIPEEIIENIDSTVVFAIANIGTWWGDYLGNSLFILYENRKVKQIYNYKLPKKDMLFTDKLSDFYNVDSLKFNTFINFISNFSDARKNKLYKTPDDLQVSGGSIHYVYINVDNSDFWISFEPESSDLLQKIENEFDSLFK